MELYSVLITGANRGIGLEFVRQILQFKSPPKHVFATYRSAQGLEALEKLRDASTSTTTVHLLKLDVTNEKDVQTIKSYIEHVVKDNGLTLLINNAGAVAIQGFPDVTAENLLFHFSTNTVGPVLVSQAMHPLLKASAARKTGQGLSFSRAGILTISSLAGSIFNVNLYFSEDIAVPGYKISKAAVNMAMRIFAAKVKGDGILVVNMCPGSVKTDMNPFGEIELKESIATMLATISKFNENQSGLYTDRHGCPFAF